MEQNENSYENDNISEAVPALEISQDSSYLPEGEKRKAKGFWRDMLETIALALVLFLILNAITSRVKVFNISMQPTLKQGYLLLVNKMAYKIGEPKNGDIIVFHYNGDKQEDYIKRVIGVPGDQVDISGGVVRVNNIALTEPYIMEVPNYSGSWQVPDGQLFVLGDNRNHSSDSHQWGYVRMDWVVGKAVLIYYPFTEVALLGVPGLVRAAPAQ
ncbi:MAG: signal peptidase I [Anaerolineaceae bacterium]|jgi:signal peptidase I|nr:signal peptidase I [Chloroflexota bacterium]HZK17601.1 signal peptidase I [Anaerolineaceae bacterium]